MKRMTRMMVLSMAVVSLLVMAIAVHAETPSYQIEALMKLYEDTDGEHWFDNTNGGGGTDPSIWYGVTCNVWDLIEAIDLRNNNFIGSIGLLEQQSAKRRNSLPTGIHGVSL